MTSQRTRANASAVTRKFAALWLLIILAASGCSQPPASARSTGSAATAIPTTSLASASPSTTPASPSTAPTVPASFDPALAAKLQASLEDSVTELHYPALAAAVILPDGSSWSGAAGKSDVEADVPATPDTSFAIGSITKTFMATLVLELAHDGMLSLDDPIANWLPQLADDARFMADRVTVRQLLDHTSGIDEYLNPAFVPALAKDTTRRWTLDEILAFVGDPAFEPGTEWAYSNTNYLLVGMIIEQASGSTVASVLRERILAPLGLEQTVLQPQERPDGPTAHGYVKTPNETVGARDGSGLTPNTSMASAAWTAGGIASTAPDLARWASALYGGRVLDAASLAEMLDFKLNGGLRGGGGYGLGVGEWFGRGGVTIGHGGRVPGFESLMWYYTKPRATVVILSNTDVVSSDAAYFALEAIVLAHLHVLRLS
jgi:D-alanyl-D-alanine carboxypeptidase